MVLSTVTTPAVTITDFGALARDNSGNPTAPAGTPITLYPAAFAYSTTDLIEAGGGGYTFSWTVSRNGTAIPSDSATQDGGGINSAAGPMYSFTFTPTEDGTYVVSVTATSDIDLSRTTTTSETIDVAPRVAIQGSQGLALTGAADPSFGNRGQVITSLNTGDDGLYAVAVQKDGKIVTAGWTASNNYDIALARYNPNGTLDTTFGSTDPTTGQRTGTTTTDIANGSSDFGLSVAIDSQGRIVVGGETSITQPDGSTPNYSFLARYNSNGTLDTSFGNNGFVIGLATDLWNASSMTIDGQDRIVVTGISANGPAVARYTSSGALDTTFGSNGVELIQVDPNGGFSPSSVTIDGQGRILVAGTDASIPSADFEATAGRDNSSNPQPTTYTKAAVVARYDSQGNPDSTFGGTGFVMLAPGSASDSAAVGIGGFCDTIVTDSQGGGVVEWTANTGLAELLRFTPSGALATDPTTGFGALNTATDTRSGSVLTSIATQTGPTNGLILQPDGSIIVAGNRGTDFGLARYNADGSPDGTFAPGGTTGGPVALNLIDFSPTDPPLDGLANPLLGNENAAVLGSNGKIVMVGETSGNAATPGSFLLEQVVGTPPHSPVGTTLSFTSTVNDPNASPTYQWTVTKDGSSYALPSGTVTNTSNFSFAPNALGTYVVTLAVTDPDGTTVSDSKTIVVTSLTAQSLQQALPQNTGSANAVTIEASANVAPSTVISAVNGLSNVTQHVTITLDLGGGTYSSGGVAANPPPNVTFLVENGTLDPNYPALTVAGGQVVVSNCTLTTSGNAPTLLVTGGIVTLSNDNISQTSTTSVEPAISITGGTVNLGTASAPGNNTLSVSSSGDLVSNTSGNPISAVGDTFVVGSTVETAPNLSFTTLTSSAAPSILNQAVTLTVSVQANGSSITPTGSVDFFDTTTNTDLGSVSLSGGVATLTTSTLAPGNHVIVAKYSGDANFLPSANTFTQSVHYKFSGFLPPLSNGLTFAVNRTIPIKFSLSDANGNAVTSLSAVTSLQIQTLDANGNPVSAPFTPASTNNQGLQYTGGQYQLNWQTKGLAPGSYQIVLTLADGTTQIKKLQLTAGGSSAGLVTGSSGGTTTTGALLGGEVDLYIDNSNGDLTSDELARIQDAVIATDSTIAPYGVTIIEVSDPTQANVTLTMNTTSALGGAAQGVLGCTTDADQVTMIQGWDWYAGSDATQIGAGQYDFETAVMHELGHVLGLGHSSNASSVMYANLAPGTTERTLTTADLNVSDNDNGGPCALQAALATPVTGPSLTPTSDVSLPVSSAPSSAVDQLLSSSDLARLLSGMLHAYQSEVSSLLALWQQDVTLFVQRFDALLSMGYGARSQSMPGM